MRRLSRVHPFALGRGLYDAAMRVLVALLLVLLLVPTWSGLSRLPLLGRDATMTAMRVALDPDDPERVRVGRLTYLGGVALDSPDPAFGGVSAMTVVGDRFTLLSDGGNLVRFRMTDWRVRDVSFGALPGGPGTGWLKEDRDSESLARDPATGRVWVGFERGNAIWRFSPGLVQWERRSRPSSMRDWPSAGGPETMVRLSDGSFVVLSERARIGGGGRRAVRFAGDPAEHSGRAFGFVYQPPARYEPSDAAELPDGRLLVLNRRFRLPFDFTAKLTIVDARAIRPGARVVGREIATLAAPLLHDNFEALAVTVEEGVTIVWIASDDNELFLQRTLLLKFRLEPGS